MKAHSNMVWLLLGLVCFACNQKQEQNNISNETRHQIQMTTSYGDMVFELYNETPLHRDNFINLVKQRAYDSLLFHRVIKDFMIQGGDPESKRATATDTLGEGDVPYVVKAEFNNNLFHKKGVLAAARDNRPDRASSGMQFYIVQGKTFTDSLLNKVEDYLNKNKAVDYYKANFKNKSLVKAIKTAINSRKMERYNLLRDSVLSLANREADFSPYIMPENQRKAYKTFGGTPHLDQTYTVFGEMVSGIDVLDSIANTKTNNLSRPLQDIRILSVNLVE